MERLVVTSETPPASSFTPATRIICRVCHKQFSQYTCPRCNARYCSLQCYQRHGLRCTESFMRENVMEELGQMQPDSETKRKMLDILGRLHLEEEASPSKDEDDEEEDDFMLSEDTIRKISSGHDISLEDLSADEIKQFKRALASGELSKMIEPWEQWWLKPSARTIALSQEGSQLVRPVDEQGPDTSPPHITEVNLSEIPAGPEAPLPSISKLSHRDASPLLAVHLVDVLFSYCFTLRLYNGDWRCDPLGAALVVFSMSSVLGEGGQPEIVAEALGNCLERACLPGYRHAGGFWFGCSLLDDIIGLLSLGTNALVCALCDLQRLILAGERALKYEKMGKEKRVETRNKLRHAGRKVYFLMCWVHEQPGDAWSSLAGIVGVEKASLASVDEGYKPVKVGPKEEPRNKVLIKEL